MIFILVLRNHQAVSEMTEFEKMLSEMDRYLLLTDGIYMLKTDWTAVEIRDNIKKMNDDVVVFVSAVKAPAAWKNMDADNEDIKTMLRF